MPEPVTLRLPAVFIDPQAGTIRPAIEVPAKCLSADQRKAQRAVLGGLFRFSKERSQ